MSAVKVNVTTEPAEDAARMLHAVTPELDYLWARIAEWQEMVEAGELEADEMLVGLDRMADELDEHRATMIKAREALLDQAWKLRRALDH